MSFSLTSNNELLATLQALKGQQQKSKSRADRFASETATEQLSILERFSLFLFPDLSDSLLLDLRAASLRLLLLCPFSLGFTFFLGAPFLALPALHYFFERRSLLKKLNQRVEHFESDYTAFLIALSSSVKAGRDPLSALLESERMFSRDSEIQRQIGKMRQSLDRMTSEETAIFQFAGGINNPDISLFRIAFLLARKEGSALSLCLERLARVTRQRQSFRRKVRGAVALQRVSSYGIAAIALLTLSFQMLTNLENFKLALNHPLGMIGLSIGALLITLGLLWMSRIAPARF